MDDKESFLSRWSRRKVEAKELPSGALPAVELPATAPTVPPAPVTEHAVPDLAQGISAEYREFFDPQVDETLRRIALKRLFSDPQFNVMDGLDTYIDDYSKPDPIPEAMLRQLNQAKGLFLFDDEKKPDAGAGDEANVAADLDQALPSVPAARLNSADPAPADVPEADTAAGISAIAHVDEAGNN